MSAAPKKAVLLNDTATRYHHGCSRVMRLLVAGLARAGIEVIHRGPSRSDWSKDGAFAQAVARADLIVINGEGTLHQGKPAGEALLRLATDPLRQGKPLALINALYQDNPDAWGAYLKQFSLIAARDSASAVELARASGQQVRWLPDLSLSAPAETPPRPRTGVLLGDSVRLSARQALARAAANFPEATYLPTKTLRHPIWHRRATRGLSRRLLYAAYNGALSGSPPRFEMADDEHAYLALLAQAELHITGRFHAVCLSMLTETPFLALASNASKIERLLSDAGLARDRLSTPEALRKAPAQRPFSEAELSAIRAFRAKAISDAQALFSDLAALA